MNVARMDAYRVVSNAFPKMFNFLHIVVRCQNINDSDKIKLGQWEIEFISGLQTTVVLIENVVRTLLRR